MDIEMWKNVQNQYETNRGCFTFTARSTGKKYFIVTDIYNPKMRTRERGREREQEQETSGRSIPRKKIGREGKGHPGIINLIIFQQKDDNKEPFVLNFYIFILRMHHIQQQI